MHAASREISARAGRASDRVQLGDSKLHVSGERRLKDVHSLWAILLASRMVPVRVCMHTEEIRSFSSARGIHEGCSRHQHFSVN